MHDPSLPAALSDEALKHEVINKKPAQRRGIPRNRGALSPSRKESLQTALEVHARWRPLRPHGIAIHDGKSREDTSYRVCGESPVEVLQCSRTHGNESRDDCSCDSSCPERRTIE